jgi:hypothetical protein
MASGANHAFHIGLHEHLNDRLGNGAQEIAISGFGHSSASGRVSSVVGSSRRQAADRHWQASKRPGWSAG